MKVGVSPQFCAGTAGYRVGGVGTIPLGGGPGIRNPDSYINYKLYELRI